MRRAIIRSAGVVEVEEAAELVAGPGEVLIAPDAVGICGTDLELLDGTMTYLRDGKASLPLVPGHEWTGIVRSCGKGVTGFAEGDRVVGETSVGCGKCDRCRSGAYHLCDMRTETGLFGRDGALGTQLLHPARATHRVPPGAGWRNAVLMEPLAVAYRALARAGDLPSRLAVLGGGTLGHACALAARALADVEVSVIERDPARRGLYPSLLYGGGDPPWPLVVEATGAPSGLEQAIEMCADAGTVVVLGLTGKASVPFNADDVVVRDLTIRGSLSSPGAWRPVIDLVASGKLDAARLISHEFALEDAAEAFAHVRKRLPGTFKVVVHPNPVPEAR